MIFKNLNFCSIKKGVQGGGLAILAQGYLWLKPCCTRLELSELDNFDSILTIRKINSPNYVGKMPKSGFKLPQIVQLDGSPAELKRAKYLLAFLLTKSEAQACKCSGLSRKAHARIVHMFIEKGNAADNCRSGRPTLYTADVMDAAYNVLTDPESGLLTGRKLKKRLVAEGILHADSDDHNFLIHLKEHIKSQGRRLITNSVQTTFYITKTDVADRLLYAQKMTDLLKQISLEDLVFVDEVTLEESPHPKGKCHILTQVSNSGQTNPSSVLSQTIWPWRMGSGSTEGWGAGQRHEWP
jgi:hypothetical protein